MNCDYCYSPPGERTDMTVETAQRTVDFGMRINEPGSNVGLVFFGGEPLLKKDIIKSTISYCKKQEKERGYRFHYKMTTNGLLLDKDFIRYASAESIDIALSIDGVQEVHDAHRKTKKGAGTFKVLDRIIDPLLKALPYTTAMMTLAPDMIPHFARSAEYLFERGFRYVNVAPDYSAQWTEGDFEEIIRQYEILADLYEKWTLEERKFYFAPFEIKIASHIQGAEILCDRCHLGMKQLSIAPDGGIYPCIQFVGDGKNKTRYLIGDVINGIDEDRRMRLYIKSKKENTVCAGCALAKRCNHKCSCLNLQTTGSMSDVSPYVCRMEQLLTPISDRLGEKLYKAGAPMFIQKHYNPDYPIISVLEDMMV